MKKILCFLGFHNWTSNQKGIVIENPPKDIDGEEIYRECKYCHKKERLVESYECSGMASYEIWEKV